MTAMLEEVRVIRIFVSHPGDVVEEIEDLKWVVNRINGHDGERCGARLELWEWQEKAARQIGGDGPQAGINEQLPDYDIYFGIMRRRCGKGTVEEFHDALNRKKETGRPVILFFFDDELWRPKKNAERDDFNNVYDFRMELEGYGLVNPYDNCAQDQHFRVLAEDQLRKELNNIVGGGAATEGTGAEPKDWPEYRNWLRKRCSGVDLLGAGGQGGNEHQLSRVYVPITTREPSKSNSATSENGSTETCAIPLLELLGEVDSLYVTGEAGTGKSTFCRWVSLILCNDDVPSQEIEPPDEFREHLPDTLRGRLPVLIQLSKFWDFLPKGEDKHVDLEDVLAEWLKKTKPHGLDWSNLQAHLKKGKTLLIFDGIDEVPREICEHSCKCQPLGNLLAGLAEAIPGWCAANNRVLVTGRPYGLEPREANKLPARTAPIGELEPSLAELLIERSFAVLLREKGQPIAEKMIGELDDRDDLSAMTINPLLLTAMCLIYSRDPNKQLPQDWYELYKEVVDEVLRQRYPNSPGKIEEVGNLIRKIAYAMHTGVDLDEEPLRSEPRVEILVKEIDRVILAFRGCAGKGSVLQPDKLAATETRHELLKNTGLLFPRATTRAAFYHLSLQEFLAAEEWWETFAMEPFEHLVDEWRRRAAVVKWRDTLSFAFGAMLADGGPFPNKSSRLLERALDSLSPESLETELPVVVALAKTLELALRKGYELRERKPAFCEICLEAIKREISVPERRALALVLGRLGDPRVIGDLRQRDARNPFGQSAFVEIPADTYLVGEEKLQQKKPWRLTRPFWAARYPVTNSQFALFLEEGGYKNREWWSEDGWAWKENKRISEPRYWRSIKWNGPNQPVVGVSFYEAEAFAMWAGGRLPTGKEWEAAARGPQGYDYPWGNQWQDVEWNYAKVQPSCTSPVGLFLRTKSNAFGLEDIAGNVWEWCTREFTKGRPYLESRGGNWASPADSCRCSYRNRTTWVDRFDGLGFRIVVDVKKSADA